MHRICRFDTDKHTVTGEVYAPNVLDTYGCIMTPEDVELLCHRFAELCDPNNSVDMNHTQQPVSCRVVESWINRGHPDYNEGAWVATVQINDEEIFDAVVRGDLNAFSFDILAHKRMAVAEVIVDPVVVGTTEISEGHSHFFFANLDDDGRVIEGRTSTDDNHSHNILRGTATEYALTANGVNHKHRFFL